MLITEWKRKETEIRKLDNSVINLFKEAKTGQTWQDTIHSPVWLLPSGLNRLTLIVSSSYSFLFPLI